ncbi:hypothetical protein RvY_16515 [Ramazzottius varieornatus]|uniref:Uncharacterized protein n=1 Tax=Ramazzottius varieornatus TaxID=947166 RepID=A0A1D1W6A7_RAMVA|nr:hypothetical protein RvY_16515 [Ramazzottius varieornatus]
MSRAAPISVIAIVFGARVATFVPVYVVAWSFLFSLTAVLPLLEVIVPVSFSSFFK